MCDSEQWLKHKGTVGKAVYGEVHVLDEEMREVPPRTVGKLWFKTAYPFEYFNCEEPDKTVKSQINMRHGFAGKAIRGTTYVKFDLQLRVVGPGQSDEALLLGPVAAV